MSGERGTVIVERFLDALLPGKVMTYDWGKIGSESDVYQIHQGQKQWKSLLSRSSDSLSSPSDSASSSQTAYAEFWLTTHPNGPSVLAHDPCVSLRVSGWRLVLICRSFFVSFSGLSTGVL